MSVWVLAQWFEAMIISSKKNMYYREIPGFSVGLFVILVLYIKRLALAVAIGIIAQCYYEEGIISRKFQFVLNSILGTRNLFPAEKSSLDDDIKDSGLAGQQKRVSDKSFQKSQKNKHSEIVTTLK